MKREILEPEILTVATKTNQGPKLARAAFKIKETSGPRILPRTGLKMYSLPKCKIIEQNPAKSSFWAKIRRSGHTVYQVLDYNGRYLGVLIRYKDDPGKDPSSYHYYKYI